MKQYARIKFVQYLRSKKPKKTDTVTEMLHDCFANENIENTLAYIAFQIMDIRGEDLLKFIAIKEKPRGIERLADMIEFEY